MTALVLSLVLSQGSGMNGTYCDGWEVGWPAGWCNNSRKACPSAPPPPRCMLPGLKTAFEHGFVDAFGEAMKARKKAKRK